MLAKETEGLNRNLSSNFWWFRKANHVKFTDERVMCTEEHVLVKKNVYKWAKHGPEKKVMLTIFGDIKGPIVIDLRMLSIAKIYL